MPGKFTLVKIVDLEYQRSRLPQRTLDFTREKFCLGMNRPLEYHAVHHSQTWHFCQITFFEENLRVEKIERVVTKSPNRTSTL